MKTLSRAGIVLGALALWTATSGQAAAALDELYPNSASWTVNLTPDANVSNTFTAGVNGHTTLNTGVYEGDAIAIAAGWAIKNNAPQSGADTAYPRTVTFTANTITKPLGAPNVAVSAIANCAVTSAASTCATNIAFTVPSVAGSYLVQINTNAGGGAGQLNTRQLSVNFTVVEVEDIDTTLTVAQQCYLLNQTEADLTATLQEMLSGDPIEGEQIDFYINPTPGALGSADTDGSGVATLTVDLTGLPVGDHTLSAEFLENPPYNGSSDSETLGITYMFLGFGEPINGDGTSIFGGRVIPVKIRLADANGDPVADAAPTVWIEAMNGVAGIGTTLEPATSVSAADTGNIMRWSPEDKHYIYNFDAMGLPNGVYKIVVQLGDSDTCRTEDPYAIITVARKGGKK